jgi:hypothetical protein
MFIAKYIGMRPGRVSYHRPGPSPRFEGNNEGKVLAMGSFRFLGGKVLDSVKAKALVMSVSSDAYS